MGVGTGVAVEGVGVGSGVGVGLGEEEPVARKATICITHEPTLLRGAVAL